MGLATKVRNQRRRMKTNKTKTKHASCEGEKLEIADCPSVKDLRAQVLASSLTKITIHSISILSNVLSFDLCHIKYIRKSIFNSGPLTIFDRLSLSDSRYYSQPSEVEGSKDCGR